MGILTEIQGAILEPTASLQAILLKLRFLASRLDSVPLAEWVKFETEGYPKDAELPTYRSVQVIYKGTFSGPFGSGIQNAPIPAAIIAKHAGPEWVKKPVREGIAAIEDLAAQEHIGLDASNLILVLQGKIYEDYACNSVTGAISPTAMKEILSIVRARVLELTLELEKRIPNAADVTLERRLDGSSSTGEVTQIFRQTILGGLAR